MLLLGTKNTTSQTVLTNGTIALGDVYRRYCRRASNGLPTFTNTSTGITLNGEGIYHVTATLVGSGTAAGVVTVQMVENSTPITGAFSSETITTADTELRTFVIDTYIKVDKQCSLGCITTEAKTISLENTGVGATFTDVIINIDKVVGQYENNKKNA